MRHTIRFTLALLVALIPALQVAAQPSPSELSSDQLNQIKQGCRQVQVSLRSLQKRDTVLRINRGRLYDMTLRQTGAFVSRLDANKVEDPTIKQLDSNIRAEYQHFIADYDHYGDSLNTTVTIDCEAKPQEFYAALVQAADQRKTVGKDVSTIKQEIEQYITELGKLRDQLFPGAAQ
ncbi:MAG TPA: hypothetical protein VLF60_00510 [Candidatus Saccharimonadales bacterium]|nr:hypothetical protein [Candidatus Saccharimonadales bacterium]